MINLIGNLVINIIIIIALLILNIWGSEWLQRKFNKAE